MYITTLSLNFSDKLTATNRSLIIYFAVLFPILVLFAIVYLIKNHSAKLYSPNDYDSDLAFILATKYNKNKENKIEDKIK